MKEVDKFVQYFKKYFSFVISTLVVIFLIFLVIITDIDTSFQDGAVFIEGEHVDAYFGGREVVLEVVRTPEDLKKGLGGREFLEKDTGMLFVFEVPDRHGIWMKDMQFAIDVLWLDENFQIVYMVEGMTPESFPLSYRSVKDALYIVELSVGFISENGITIHDQMTPISS